MIASHGYMPGSGAELAEIVTECHATGQALRIQGGASRVQIAPAQAETLSTAAIAGVTTYEPGEMTLIARTGTPLAEIETLLAGEGQMLAFEPAHMNGVLGGNGISTIGGVVSANASGPRRVTAGACRDHLLGVRFIDGRGRVLKNGGRVMKNVTGLDLSKLMAGSFGTLGILTEIVLKTRPIPEQIATLVFSGLDEAAAQMIFTRALAMPYEVSAAAYWQGTAWLRVEGLKPQLDYRISRLTTLLCNHQFDIMGAEDTANLWRDLRDLRQFAGADSPLWRILVKPTDAPAICGSLKALGGQAMIDWGGGLIWYCGPGDALRIRALAPHATLIRRGGLAGPAFPPQSAALLRLSDGLRHSFDPAGILNPRLMEV